MMRKSPIELSIVSPVYRGENMVSPLVEQTEKALRESGLYSYEIVLVEDGSPDESWTSIEKVTRENHNVVGIKLSRNFGQHSAITAGLHYTRGDYVVVMDCDLQDDPVYIPQMLEMCKAGAPIVLARKERREHPGWKNFTAKYFNKIFNWLSEGDFMSGEDGVGTFSCLRRDVVDAFNSIKDYHRHYLMVLRWIGFRIEYLPVVHRERLEGTSSYTFGKLVAHAINGITSQSTKLLRIFVGLGFIFCLLSALSLVVIVGSYFLYGFKEGWASLISLILMSTGVIVFSLGILGIYIGQIFEQVRDRPLFVIEEILNYNAANTNKNVA